VLEFIEFDQGGVRSSLLEGFEGDYSIKIPGTDILIDSESQKPKKFYNMEVYC
jgi:hypothetical protein